MSELIERIEAALTKAFNLGKTYWQQADSESYKQNRLSDETHAKFLALKDECKAALSQNCQCAADETTGWTQEAVCNVCLRIVDGALSQQEAELVDCACGDQFPIGSYGHGWIDSVGCCANCGGMDEQEARPGASVPQDVEQFANDVAEWSQTQFEDVIRVSHFREFMRQRDAGHARVPVEPTEAMTLAAISAVSNRKIPFISDSKKVSAIWNAMITASKQEGV